MTNQTARTIMKSKIPIILEPLLLAALNPRFTTASGQGSLTPPGAPVQRQGQAWAPKTKFLSIPII